MSLNQPYFDYQYSSYYNRFADGITQLSYELLHAISISTALF